MIPCPLKLRQFAEEAGIPPAAVDGLWAEHIAYCERQGRQEYGGGMWRNLVASSAKSMAERMPTVPRTDPDVARARRLEAEAKAIEEAEYQRTAISLLDYIGELRTRDDFSQPMTDVERRIATFRDPYPGENAGAWLMAAVAGVHS